MYAPPPRGRNVIRMLPISRRLTIAATLTLFGVGGGVAGRALGAAPAAKPDARLFEHQNDPVLGNPAGRLAIAEFFDYRCPYCRRMHPVVSRLLREDHDIRFVAKNWPILGPVSRTAARVALAANWQGRFAAVHDALFSVPGKLDDAAVRDAATGADVDMLRLDHDLAQRADLLDDTLGDVALDAASLGLQGTPGFVIGPYLVPGALSYDDMRGLVDKARARSRQPA